MEKILFRFPNKLESEKFVEKAQKLVPEEFRKNVEFKPNDEMVFVLVSIDDGSKSRDSRGFCFAFVELEVAAKIEVFGEKSGWSLPC